MESDTISVWFDVIMGIPSDSSKAKKSYLVLTCGAPSLHTSLPKGKGENGGMCSDDDSDSSGEDGDRTVS
jgi:18S rRNA (guanine1575-N7)-methyltransferase